MSDTYYSNVRYDVLDMLPDKKLERVLEIGGGDFVTLQYLRQKQVFETWGLDIRPSNVDIDHMITASISDPSIKNIITEASFDLVIANDVIEHIEDTESFVHAIHWALKSNGLLLLSVPNARQIRLIYNLLVRGVFPRDDAGLFDRTHLRWFTKKDVLKAFPIDQYALVDSKTSGRLVPSYLKNSVFSELLGLHNLFVFRKI